FYLLCYCIKNKDVALVLLSVFALAIIRYAFFTGHDPTSQNATWFRGEWWYNATIMFVVGLWYARLRDRIDELLERGYKVIFPLVAVLTVASMYTSRYVLGRYGYYHEQLAFGHRDALITLLVQGISCVIFTLMIVLLNMRITIGNPILRYLSKISVTLFLVHGFFVHRVFAEVHMSDFLRYAVILATGIACASIVAPVTRFLSKQAIEYLTYEKPKNDTLEAAILEKKVAKRKRQKKVALATVLVVLAVYVGYLTLFRDMIRQREYREESEMIATAQVGDVVTFGRFDQTYRWPGKERMHWIVLQDGGDKLCLISEQGIEGSSYHRKHEVVSWKKSDLHARLNSDEFTTMFSAYELERLEMVDGDLITLLTPTQAEKLFDSPETRELVITAVAIQHRTNINELSKDNNWDMKGYRSSWWWLRSDTGVESLYAPIVTVDGEISLEEKEVNRPRGAIRPVIWVKK
ncbi:MAG: DUF6273 domain-containing protein, partial [Lachnospiraceae bacterium]|nr:DUF6273 domain-containing protein [Lachnospiraceae bacterium]